MWVYDAKETARQQQLAVKKEQSPASPASFQTSFSDDEPAPRPKPRQEGESTAEYHRLQGGDVVMPPSARPAAPKSAALQREPLKFYVAVYGIGLCLAGVIFGMCQGETIQFLQYYAQNWLNLFFEANSPLHLFSTLFLTGIFSMTVVLLFGLSAFGIPFVYALLLCKGAGSGLLALTLFLENGWKGELLYIVFPAISDIFLAWCLCSLSYFAVRSSRVFLSRTFQKESQESSFGVKLLLNRYLFLCTLQILSCGLSAVLTQYAMSWMPMLGLA
jgi:hypothetical protein